MPYTSEQEAEFKQQFAGRRKRQRALAIPMIVAVVAAAAFRNSGTPDSLGISAAVWATAFLVLVVGALIFSFRNWRCPACDRYLGRQSNPKFCSKCGVVLQ
jgi:hypothetical protein